MTTTLAPETKVPNPVMFMAARRALDAAPFGSRGFWKAYAEIRNHQIRVGVTVEDMLAHPEDYERTDVERARRFVA